MLFLIIMWNIFENWFINSSLFSLEKVHQSQLIWVRLGWNFHSLILQDVKLRIDHFIIWMYRTINTLTPASNTFMFLWLWSWKLIHKFRIIRIHSKMYYSLLTHHMNAKCNFKNTFMFLAWLWSWKLIHKFRIIRIHAKMYYFIAPYECQM